MMGKQRLSIDWQYFYPTEWILAELGLGGGA